MLCLLTKFCDTLTEYIMYIDENGGSDKRLVILMLLTVVQRAFLHFAFEMIQLPSSKIVSQKMIFVLVWFFIMRMVD